MIRAVEFYPGNVDVLMMFFTIPNYPFQTSACFP